MNRSSKRSTAGWISSEDKQKKKTKQAVEGEEEKEDVKPKKVASTTDEAERKPTAVPAAASSSGASKIVQQTSGGHMIEVILNDRLGKKIKVKCNSDDTVGDLKKLIALQIGSRPEKLRLQKWYTVFKDHIMLQDYEVTDGMSLELYYN